MSDPTHHAPRTTHQAAAGRRWPFTFTQVRLGVLMAALTFGIGGMIRNDVRLLDIGIGMAVLGVGMRLYNRYWKRPSTG